MTKEKGFRVSLIVAFYLGVLLCILLVALGYFDTRSKDMTLAVGVAAAFTLTGWFTSKLVNHRRKTNQMFTRRAVMVLAIGLFLMLSPSGVLFADSGLALVLMVLSGWSGGLMLTALGLNSLLEGNETKTVVA